MQLFELHTVLNISGESGILTKRFSVFTTEYHIGCWCVINNFYYVETSSLNNYFGTSFFFFFNHEHMLNFIECLFLQLLRMIMWFFIYLDVVDHIDGFACVEPSLWTSHDFNFVVVCDIFYNVLLNSIADILTIFTSIFIKDMVL